MRRLGGQRGQTAVEYLGVLLVVGAVIATIAASGIAATVSDAIGRQICRVASDGPCEQPVASDTDGRPAGGERLPGSGRSEGSGAPSVDLGQAQVAGGAQGRSLTLRPAVARQGAQTCFATTSGDCRPPGGAYELAPREPTPGEQIDGLLSEAGDSTEAWLGWLSGSDRSSPFYDPTAQDEREGQLEALDDGLAFLEDLNRSPSPLGSTGPLGDPGGDLGNELLGISDLRRAIDASQRGDSLKALGFVGLAWPFAKPGKAVQEGLEETTEQTGRQATREGTERAARGGADDALRALPRGTPTLTQQRLEHIVSRHWSTSGATNAGKFAPGTGARDLRSMINETARSGTFRSNTNGRPGHIYEHSFGGPIGTSSAGGATSSLRVVVDPDGNIVTAFPFSP